MSITTRKQKAEKFRYLGYAGDIAALDAEGRSLLWRAGDLLARFLLNDFSALVYVPHSSPECGATATLIHAERYLSDRLAYELAPWPKGMIKDETMTPLPDRCSHCLRLIVEPNRCSVCGEDFCCLGCCLDHKHLKENQ